MRVGFTGTREGLDAPQGGALARLIQSTAMIEFHHGCCLGADTEAVLHVKHYRPEAVIVAHVPDRLAMLSVGAGAASDIRRNPKPYLERNHNIVDESELLIACPKSKEEELRSGTWATVRYARKKGVRIILIYPDGSVSEESA